jgi:ATP-binding cassette, subfamily B, bacterial CvaB/MchF/RaxB
VASLLHFSSHGHLPVVHQTEAAECGLACLAMVASYHGHCIDLNTLRRRHPVSLKGVTLRGLIQVASQMHFACRAIRFELAHLRQLQLPAIVHWDMNHFVVMKSVTKRGVMINDPAAGQRFLPLAEASKHLTGVALESSRRRKVSSPRTSEPGCLSRPFGPNWTAARTRSYKSCCCRSFSKCS